MMLVISMIMFLIQVLALPVIFPSVISSFLENKGGGEGVALRAPPLDPPL